MLQSITLERIHKRQIAFSVFYLQSCKHVLEGRAVQETSQIYFPLYYLHYILPESPNPCLGHQKLRGKALLGLDIELGANIISNHRVNWQSYCTEKNAP